jgi:GT2 family glycosyltransferase
LQLFLGLLSTYKTPRTSKRAAHEVSGIRAFAQRLNRLLRARLFHDLANFPPLFFAFHVDIKYALRAGLESVPQ